MKNQCITLGFPQYHHQAVMISTMEETVFTSDRTANIGQSSFECQYGARVGVYDAQAWSEEEVKLQICWSRFNSGHPCRETYIPLLVQNDTKKVLDCFPPNLLSHTTERAVRDFLCSPSQKRNSVWSEEDFILPYGLEWTLPWAILE